MQVPLRTSLRILLVLVGVAVWAHCVVGQSVRDTGRHERAKTDFDDGGQAFQNSPPLPAYVLKALVSSKEVESLGDLPELKPRTDLKLYFRYTIIHLSKSNETDYLVNGVPPVSGGDCGWFWIVVSEGNRARIVLFDAADAISILKSDSQSHRDIETVWGSASGESIDHIFHYDGHTYRLVKSSDVKGKDAP
jgi:hypothetical protein